MIELNADAPPFTLEGVEGDVRRRVSLADLRGRWVVLCFYPADFTFVCPTELVGFQRRLDAYRAANAVILALSVDDVDSHTAWSRELGGVGFSLLSDPGGVVSRAYGVLNEADGRAFRSTIIVSPEGKVAYVVASPMNVGRSVEETLRVLTALQTGRLCPADWKPGDPTLDPELRY